MLLLVSLPGCYVCTQHQQRRDAFFGNTNSGKIVKSILWKVPYLHVILQGFHANVAHQFGAYLERIHFADKMPIKQASSHQKILIDYTKNKLYHELAENENIEALALGNINKRHTYIENLRSAALQKKMSIQKQF